METYLEYDPGSDIDFYSRHHYQDHSSQLLQQQAQLPSFKDIIPPHLHTAIDPQQQDHQAVVEVPSDIYTPASQALSSTSRSIATSPAQSHRSSMPSLPEHFEDVSVRTNDTMFTPQSQSMTTIDRGSSWIPTSQYHMSTNFSQPTPRMTQMGSQQLNSRTSPSSSLPPLSDLNRRSTTYDQTYATTNGQMTYVTQAASYPQLYSQTPQTTTDIDGNSFARSMSYDSTPYARFNSYPQTTRSYQTTDYSRFGTAPYDPYRYGGGYRTAYSDLGYSPHVVGSQPAAFGVPGDISGAQSRKRRGNLPKPVTDILRSWFHDHLDHPYPSEEDKQMFISKTGLTISQISNWFINARRRHWPALRQNRERARNTSALRRSNSAGASI